MRSLLCVTVLAWAAAARAEGEEPAAEEAVEDVAMVEDAAVGEAGGAAEWWGDDYPIIDRALNVMTARPVRAGNFLVTVVHRTASSFVDDPFHEYLGFDSGSLKIGLGVRYGVIDGLDVGMLRMNEATLKFDTYEFDARYQLLSQEAQGVDLALRAGASVFVQRDKDDATGFFGQVLATYLLANRLTLGGVVSFHSDSTNDKKTATDIGYTAGALVLVDVRLTDGLAWTAETGFGFLGYRATSNPIYSTGMKLITNRHTFAFVVSNTQLVGTDGLITNADRPYAKPILGFNITREL